MTNKLIGRVIATEKNPTTIDDFTFWTDQALVLNLLPLVKNSIPCKPVGSYEQIC